MNCKFINVLMFAAGAAIGSAVTWKIVKDRYERIVQEEVDAFKESYTECMSNLQEQDEDSEDDDSDTGTDVGHQINWEEYEDLNEEDDSEPNDMEKYSRLASNYTNEKGGAESMTEKPYVISPYDFGEVDGYSQFELTYYADGILEDEDYNIVNDVDELIGSDSLYTFGEYEDDSVFVRNEKLRADFQILRDYRTYAEAKRVSPKRVDD